MGAGHLYHFGPSPLVRKSASTSTTRGPDARVVSEHQEPDEPITEADRNAVEKLSGGETRQKPSEDKPTDGDGIGESDTAGGDSDTRINSIIRPGKVPTDTADPVEEDTPGENPTPEGGFTDANPTFDVENPPTATPSGRSFYPNVLRRREWWVDWVLALPLDDDGTPEEDATPTKQPIAPYRRGDAAPVRWNFGLDDADHPSTEYETVERWEDVRIGYDIHAPDRVLSDRIGLGILIPPQQDGRTITLLDWDDVRDPDTEEIHPVAKAAIDALEGYAEISQSGEGIHQFVYGEIPGGLKKFIRHIDDEPFVGDDRPMIEMYQSGRLCAMTGEHVDGSGEDVTDGQDLIDRLCWEFGTAGNNATNTPSDPFARKRDDDTPDHDTVDDAIRKAREYDGAEPEEWDTPAEWSLEYAGVLRARTRSDELSGIANWELIGYAAGIGHRDGLEKETVLDDLKEYPTPQYGYDDARARKEARAVYRKAEAGNYHPPTRERLVERGVLPDSVLDDADPVAILPNTPVGRADRFGPLSADRREEHDPIQERRDRVTDAIADAYTSRDRVHVDALMTLGKTHGAVKAAAETGIPTAILTTRGREEQYDAIADLCEEFGLSYTKLPAFTHDCETANGDHGEDWKSTVQGWYNSGATPKQIHKFAEDVLDRPLPCQADGRTCKYAAKWAALDAAPDTEEPVDVLIGHYTHAHKRKVTAGRAVAIDEFPGGAYETTLAGEHELAGAVSTYLDRTPQVPFDDYTDLLEHRDDDARRSDALAFLVDDLDPDAREAFDGRQGHAYAPLVVFTLLASDDLGNGWERAEFPDDDPRIGLFDRERNRVHIRTPPDLDLARSVVALDGTPTPELWELALDERLKHRRVLSDGEREEYVDEILGLNIVPTTDAIKPYAGGEYVNTKQDMALLEAIKERHDTKPGVITSQSALDVYQAEDAIAFDPDDGTVTDGPADRVKYYGNVIGSNEFKHTRAGAVIGSLHYGDGFIKKWGAYAGDAVEDNRNPETGEGYGNDLSYGSFGDRVLTHMREHETIQAVMRFGRDGNGATVYVHTDTLPEWVPTAGEGRVINCWSDGMKQVLDAAADLEEFRTTGIADHPAVDLSQRQVRDHLNTLAERGYLDREHEGRGFVWRDDGLHRVNDHGDVDLDAVALDDLPESEVAEVTRSSIYTWEFRKTGGDSESDTVDARVNGGENRSAIATGGSDPPDAAE